MEKDSKNTYTLQTEDPSIEVKVADEVVAVIAGIAAMEVEGVASMAGNATKDLIQKLGRKSLSKGIKIEFLEDNVMTVFVSINIKYGYNIMDITKGVQEKVKTAIENMTGLKVADVNLRVAGVSVPEEA
ncbi:putative alkaline shock family protein YloU [Aequitasia blattaphilus]|uniref:Asp23/Gls24 family envelope stress response protein n=1 Tax=Aequitasia blattaphilus TaxID=2949332 RepID=A0ABT1E5N9_9FIRM|nr:Asp23/Gls24 family envelope stress response protein [Aequitasia blattaphilus]MCP1101164.1 Asp23/Gls24 family envelope stress response protein [Aequitasia blattaphilus]MCR8613804.1 Asp23/Gls24 family envelope stress response protein [Aequitasia blattaphilus]